MIIITGSDDKLMMMTSPLKVMALQNTANKLKISVSNVKMMKEKNLLRSACDDDRGWIL